MAQQRSGNLIDSTFGMLGPDADRPALPDGTHLLDAWIQALKREKGAGQLTDLLRQLRHELQDPNPAAEPVSRLLRQLADATDQATQDVAEDDRETLLELAALLRQFGETLT